MGPNPAFVRLAEMMEGFRVSQCITVASQLGLADVLEGTPISTDQLAGKVGADIDALRRLMRTLASIGIFAHGDGDTWVQSELSELLRSDHPGNLRDRANALGELAWSPWGHLLDCVKQGGTGFERVFGTSFFEHLQANPPIAAGFQRTMSSFTRATAGAVAASHDFSGYQTIVDLGGGQGTLLDIVLANATNLVGTILDRPEVIQLGAPSLRPEVRARTSLVAADFFADELPVADAYVLSWILHDWDDEQSVALLRRIAAVMSDSAELLIVEMVIEGDRGDPDTAPAKLFDLEMMVQTGGRERSRAEYRALIEAAGLKLDRLERTPALHSILVART